MSYFCLYMFPLLQRFQMDTRLYVRLSSQSYNEFLQTKYDNRRDFHVKEMSICDIHVDSMSKLHQISINSKFKFSLEYATSGVVTWKSQGHVKFDELCFGGESIRH